MAVIYGLVDPEEPDHIRYVGVTNNLEQRSMQHRKWPPKMRPMSVRPWLIKLHERGVRPTTIALDIAPAEKEWEWITTLRAAGHRLFNHESAALGRPLNPRDRKLPLHLTANELVMVEDAAGAAGKDVRAWVRDVLLSAARPSIPQAPPVARGPLDILLEEHGPQKPAIRTQ